MVVQCNVPILMPVELKLCKLWQILHDQALKFVAEFSLLFEFGPFTFRNIAHGKKEELYLKKHSNIGREKTEMCNFTLYIWPEFSQQDLRGAKINNLTTIYSVD